jgi:putative FmdB family regulatory protein
MPLYEYVCHECKIEEELLQGFDGKAPKCEKCKKIMKRKFSTTSFALKGEGWYKDGYQKQNKPKGDS